MSNALVGVDSMRMTIGEMLRYVGMCCWCHVIWSPRITLGEAEENDTPAFNLLNRYMSRWHFLAITLALVFVLLNPPTFWDKGELGYEHRLKRAHGEDFPRGMGCLPGWVMSIWHHRWTCRGWVFCPRKPHPFGNEDWQAFCFWWSWSRGRITRSKLKRGEVSSGRRQDCWCKLLMMWIGTLMAISGGLDGVKYFLGGLKEPSCVIKMMATGGPLIAK